MAVAPGARLRIWGVRSMVRPLRSTSTSTRTSTDGSLSPTTVTPSGTTSGTRRSKLCVTLRSTMGRVWSEPGSEFTSAGGPFTVTVEGWTVRLLIQYPLAGVMSRTTATARSRKPCSCSTGTCTVTCGGSILRPLTSWLFWSRAKTVTTRSNERRATLTNREPCTWDTASTAERGPLIVTWRGVMIGGRRRKPRAASPISVIWTSTARTARSSSRTGMRLGVTLTMRARFSSHHVHSTSTATLWMPGSRSFRST